MNIQLTNSWQPGPTFEETGGQAFHPIKAVHLNIPSIYVPARLGRLVSTVRTATNVSGLRQTYTVQTTAPAGASITVQPSLFTLEPGQSTA